MGHTDKTLTEKERLAALDLLAELWIVFPKQIEGRDGTAKDTLNLLRQGCRHSSRPLQVASRHNVTLITDVLGRLRIPSAILIPAQQNTRSR